MKKKGNSIKSEYKNNNTATITGIEPMPKPSLMLPMSFVSPMLFRWNFDVSLNWCKERFMTFSASPSSYKMEAFTPVYSKTMTMWTQIYLLIMLSMIWHSLTTYLGICVNSLQSIRLVMRHILGYCLHPRYPRIIVSIVSANQGGITSWMRIICSSYTMPNQHIKEYTSIHELLFPRLITSLITIIERVG